MPLLVYLNYAYVLPRFILWGLLLAAAITDGIRHKNIRSQGYQLYWSLVGVILLYFVRECLLLVCAVGGSPPPVGTFDAYIFFTNLADSVWFAILLCVAAGYCITRTSLGPHRTVIIIIPVIFFVTSLVVDYVLYYARGFEAFDVDTAYDPNSDDGEVSEVTGLVFFVCIIANMMAFMLAWFYIFDTIQKEREILEGRANAVPDAAVSVGAPGQAVGESVGHREVPDDILLLEAQGGNASHLPVIYGGVINEDPDAPKTVQERMEHREKIRLMRQFFYGVSFYVIATLLVLFLPIFVSSTVDKTMLILQNGVLWLFLLSLCFIFRMREDNPYLMLDEDAGGLGGVETTTELGVIVQGGNGSLGRDSPPPSYAQVAKAGPAMPGSTGMMGGVGAVSAAPAPAAAGWGANGAAEQLDGGEGGYSEQHFTLGDEDEGHHLDQRLNVGGPSSSDPADVNGDAARQGVLVTVLPSPKV